MDTAQRLQRLQKHVSIREVTSDAVEGSRYSLWLKVDAGELLAYLDTLYRQIAKLSGMVERGEVFSHMPESWAEIAKERDRLRQQWEQAQRVLQACQRYVATCDGDVFLYPPYQELSLPEMLAQVLEVCGDRGDEAL